MVAQCLIMDPTPPHLHSSTLSIPFDRLRRRSASSSSAWWCRWSWTPTGEIHTSVGGHWVWNNLSLTARCDMPVQIAVISTCHKILSCYPRLAPCATNQANPILISTLHPTLILPLPGWPAWSCWSACPCTATPCCCTSRCCTQCPRSPPWARCERACERASLLTPCSSYLSLLTPHPSDHSRVQPRHRQLHGHRIPLPPVCTRVALHKCQCL